MHYALINEENIVQQVIIASAEEIALRAGTWVQTDPSGISPKNYAGIGHLYNSGLNAFISPSPHPSYVLNENAQWECSVAYPGDDNNRFRWDEDTVSWISL